MVQKFFLALDYESGSEIYNRGSAALQYLEKEFGKDFLKDRVGVKLNVDALTGCIDKSFLDWSQLLYWNEQPGHIFGDLKISHGSDTGKRVMEKLVKEERIPLSYVTVAANFGTKILREYVEAGKDLGVNIIAFTVHTKIPPADVKRMYNRSLEDEIYILGQIAAEAGCDAMVSEGKMLENVAIRDLPIKKLVTGIRLDPSDAGTQSRVTAVNELSKLKPYVDYAVISSKNVTNPESLKEFFNALK